MTDIVITAACRTAIGAFNGALAGHSAADLGQVVISEALKRSQVKPEDVSEVVMGNVLTAAAGIMAKLSVRCMSVRAGASSSLKRSPFTV